MIPKTEHCAIYSPHTAHTQKKMMAVEMSISLPCLSNGGSSFCYMEPDLIRLQRHALPLNQDTSRSLDLSLIGTVLASCQGSMDGNGLAMDINKTGKTGGQHGNHSTSWTGDWPPMIPPGPKPMLKPRQCYRYSVRSLSGPSGSSATGNNNIYEPCEEINALLGRAALGKSPLVSQNAKDNNYHSREDDQEGMESKERGQHLNSPHHDEELSTVWVGRNAKIKMDNKKGKKRSTLIGTSKRDEEGKEEEELDKVEIVTMQLRPSFLKIKKQFENTGLAPH